jgi:dipeptidyl-peptidase 4
MRPALRIPFLVLLTLAPGLLAQGTKADYERWAKLQETTRGLAYHTAATPSWNKDGTAFVYRNDLPGGAREWVQIQASDQTRRPAFDAARLAPALAKALGKPLEVAKLPVEALVFGDANTLRFTAETRRWSLDLATYAVKEMPAEAPRTPRRADAAPQVFPSPDGKLEALLQDSNVLVRGVKAGPVLFRSRDGNIGDAYAGELLWSPDSKKLAAIRATKVEQRRVTFVESSPKDQLQPKVHTNDYTKPGDPLPMKRPQLFDLERKVQLPVSDALAPNPYNVNQLRWATDSSRLTYVYNQRGHQVLRVISVDAKTGESKAIVDERATTFIDYSGKSYLEFLDDRNELVWMSERDGWNHLYLVDSRTGAVKNPITKGSWVVRDVARLDPQARTLILRVNGVRPGEDPYFYHYASVNLDGTGFRLLTEGQGTHRAVFSPDWSTFVDTWSRVDQPPVTELRRVSDGQRVSELERADVTDLLKTGLRAPVPLVAKGRDGKTDIFGVVCLPSNFDPKKKYPVIEYIYAGPHDSFVPKAFLNLHYQLQAMAELGFITVQLDGMGTSNRSKAFHDVCWQNLGDSGFPDRILWIQAAAKKYPQMDLARVGIFGGSAGGQSSTRALLAYGDFYKVAVSDCGCHDNRMDKIWWNEQWMGWPIGPHYEEQSNVTQAKNLKGKLLLIVGEVDTNVDPASTYQVADALIRADKDFEFLVMTGSNHGSAESPYGRRRRADFFVRNLLGVEPRR